MAAIMSTSSAFAGVKVQARVNVRSTPRPDHHHGQRLRPQARKLMRTPPIGATAASSQRISRRVHTVIDRRIVVYGSSRDLGERFAVLSGVARPYRRGYPPATVCTSGLGFVVSFSS